MIAGAATIGFGSIAEARDGCGRAAFSMDIVVCRNTAAGLTMTALLRRAIGRPYRNPNYGVPTLVAAERRWPAAKVNFECCRRRAQN